MYYVYVLRSEKDTNLYIGCTGNLAKRLQTHQNGLVRSTRSRLPLLLIYQENFPDRHQAYQTEKLYKTAAGKRLLKEKMKNCQIV